MFYKQGSNPAGKARKTHSLFRTFDCFLGLMLFWARGAHNKTVVASQGATTSSRFRNQKWWLELSEGDENWNERWLGHGQRLEGIGIRIMRAHNRARSMRSELCEHRYRVSCFIQLWKLACTFNWTWPMAGGSCFGDPVCAVRVIVRSELCSTYTLFPAFKVMFPDSKTAFDFRILWKIEHEACAESFGSAFTVFLL